MAPPYRRGWGGSFTFEPLDRYKETNREQTKFLMGTALKDVLNRSIARVGERQLTAVPKQKEDNSPWGKFKRGVDRVTPDEIEAPAKRIGNTTMDVLGAGQKYVGAPIGGVLSGRLGAESQVGPDGKTRFRETSSLFEKQGWKDLGSTVKQVATQSPIETYREGKTAWEEGQRDPGMNTFMRIAGDTLTDPLNVIGPGAVGGLLRAAPAGVRASRGARFAGAILENPGRVTAGSTLGAATAGQVADTTGHEKLIAPAAFVGGFAGGVAGGLTGRPASAPAPVSRGLTPAVQNVETDLPTTREGWKSYYLKQGYDDALADREAWKEMYNAARTPEARTAREVGDLKTPYRENMERVGKDRGTVAMGRKALLARLGSEVSKGNIVPEAADSGRWFIKSLPEKYLERLASSYVKGDPSDNIAGQYVKFNGIDEDDGLIRIIKSVTNRQAEPERVIVHEIGHHLEQFVDDADYTALRSQWEREMGTRGGIFPGSGEGGQRIVDAQPGLAKEAEGLGVTPSEADAANEAYRYTGGFGEWFAENIADRAVRDAANAADDLGPWKRAWESVKDIADAVYRWLLKRGEKDAAERVYKNLLSGKYEGVGRGMGTDAVQNLPADDEFRRLSDKRWEESWVKKEDDYHRPLSKTSPADDLRRLEPAPEEADVPRIPQPGLAKQKVKKPAIDIFNTLDPSRRLATEGVANDTMAGIPVGRLRQKVDQGAREIAANIGGEKFDKNLRQGDDTVFTVKEKGRLEGVTRSLEAEADDLWVAMEQTGIPLTKGKDGVTRLPNGAAFEDMFEGRTPAGKKAFAALSPEQQAAIERMRDFGEELNANMRYHNSSGTLGWDEADEAYFPRISIGVDGEKRAYLGGPGRKLGTKMSFEKSRTYKTFEEGLAEGIDYADPRQAWKVTARAKLRAAADDYIAAGLKPMGKTLKQVEKAGGKVGIDWVAVPMDVAPALSGRYFPPDVAERIVAAYTDKPMVNIGFIKEANRILTPFRATGDISWFAQQGAAMLFRHPLKATEGAGKVIASAFGNRKHYDDLIAKQKTHLRSHIQHGLQWNEGDELAAIDYGFVKADTAKGKIASKPGIKQAATVYNKVAGFSNETFSRYMNYSRLTLANEALERLQRLKKTMTPEEYRKEYMGAMDAVNRMTGRTNRKVSSLEAHWSFAPSYFSAAVEQLGAAVAKGGMEGHLARRHMLSMVGFGGVLAFAANTARGYETDFDPRSNNFLRIRNVGGLDVSPFGTFDTLFRAVAGTAAGDDNGGPDVMALWKLAEGKMSPGIKLIYEPFIKQSTYSGEPLDPTSLKGLADIGVKQAVSAMPFSIQNIIEEGVKPSVEERSVKPLLSSLPGVAASAIGTTNAPVTPTETRNWRRDEVAQEKFGKDYDDLTGNQKSIVNEDEKIVSAQEEADENTLTRADDRSEAQQGSIEALTRVNALTKRYDPNGDGSKSGEIDAKEFRKNYHDIQMWMRGNRDAFGDQGKSDLVDQWFDLFSAAEREDGSTDFDKLDALQADFRAKNPEIDAEIDAITGTRDNATMRRFRVAQGQAQEYYKLPRYQGLTYEEGERAGEILGMVSRLVGNDQAVGYKMALNIMVQAKAITPEERTLALRAQKLGKSKERKDFEATHPEYQEFYGNRVASLGDVAVPDVGTYAGDSGGGKLSIVGGRGGRRSRRGGADVNNLTPVRGRRGVLA